jgi:hypothetical protein
VPSEPKGKTRLAQDASRQEFSGLPVQSLPFFLANCYNFAQPERTSRYRQICSLLTYSQGNEIMKQSLLVAALIALAVSACGKKEEAPVVEAPAVEAPAVEAPAVEAPAVEAPASEVPAAGASEVPAEASPAV